MNKREEKDVCTEDGADVLGVHSIDAIQTKEMCTQIK